MLHYFLLHSFSNFHCVVFIENKICCQVFTVRKYLHYPMTASDCCQTHYLPTMIKAMTLAAHHLQQTSMLSASSYFNRLHCYLRHHTSTDFTVICVTTDDCRPSISHLVRHAMRRALTTPSPPPPQDSSLDCGHYMRCLNMWSQQTDWFSEQTNNQAQYNTGMAKR